jgi:hypothetical protein
MELILSVGLVGMALGSLLLILVVVVLSVVVMRLQADQTTRLLCPWCGEAITVGEEVVVRPCARQCVIGPYGQWICQSREEDEP